jgi:hypothetical protein
MKKDFYLNDRALAAYVEKDWFDHILDYHPRKPEFAFAPFDASLLYSNYHQRLVEFLAGALNKAEARPLNLLEVGSSLGRTFYEVCQKINSVKRATLIEPSVSLFSTFNQIFTKDGVAQLSILKGNLEMAEVSLNTASIRAACCGVEVTPLNSSFQELKGDVGKFDLIICSNVIDQCYDHLQLVEFLQRSPAAQLHLSVGRQVHWQCATAHQGHQ